MEQFRWSALSGLQLGRYAEYLVKMEFTKLGCSVFSAEVDDRGIDFVIRTRQGRHYDVQVKSVRNLNYTFIRKNGVPQDDKGAIAENFYVALALFSHEDRPELYLIPATRWQTGDSLFVSPDYVGKKSKPEYGLRLTKTKLALLEPFAFSKTASLFA